MVVRIEPGSASELASLLDESPDPGRAVYEIEHLVSMIDVDAAQIHYSSYIRWMDIGTNALLAALEVPVQAILAAGMSLPVVDVHCTFHAPIGLGQVVTCRSFFARCGRTSIQSRHEFTAGPAAVATGTLVQVWMEPVDGHLAPREVPRRLRSAVVLSAHTDS
jgi:acyl-CoA thioester hydrolase